MSDLFPRINLAEVEDVERDVILYGLLYRGLNNKLVAPTGKGKTVLGTRLVIDALRSGETPVHLDMEIGQAGSKSLYLAHGATLEELAAIRYAPMPSPTLETADEFVAAILDAGETFALFDKKPDFLRTMRLAENSNDDQSEFYGRLIDPLREKVTTLLLAPTGHAGENEQGSRARGGSESDYKYDAIWQLSVLAPFDRTRVGRVQLKCTKDRWGYIGTGRLVEFDLGGDGAGHIVFREASSGFQSAAEQQADANQQSLVRWAVAAARAVADGREVGSTELVRWMDANIPAADYQGSREERLTAIKAAAKLPPDVDGISSRNTGAKRGRHDVWAYTFRRAS